MAAVVLRKAIHYGLTARVFQPRTLTAAVWGDLTAVKTDLDTVSLTAVIDHRELEHVT